MYARIIGAGQTLEIGGCLLEKQWAITSRTKTIIIAALFSESVLTVSLGCVERPPGCVEPPIVTEGGACVCLCGGRECAWCVVWVCCVGKWCGGVYVRMYAAYVCTYVRNYTRTYTVQSPTCRSHVNPSRTQGLALSCGGRNRKQDWHQGNWDQEQSVGRVWQGPMR